MKTAFWAPGITTVLILTSALALGNHRKKDPAAVSQIALSRQLATEIGRQAKVITDPIIVEYLNGLGQNLFHNVTPNIRVTIEVIDSENENAFALPGGFIFLNATAILKADNEAALARVMAYELAHVCAERACPPFLVEHEYVFRKAEFLVVKSHVLALHRMRDGQADSDRTR
jgi:predicted Zn-dependent protease